MLRRATSPPIHAGSVNRPVCPSFSFDDQLLADILHRFDVQPLEERVEQIFLAFRRHRLKRLQHVGRIGARIQNLLPFRGGEVVLGDLGVVPEIIRRSRQGIGGRRRNQRGRRIRTCRAGAGAGVVGAGATGAGAVGAGAVGAGAGAVGVGAGAGFVGAASAGASAHNREVEPNGVAIAAEKTTADRTRGQSHGAASKGEGSKLRAIHCSIR